MKKLILTQLLLLSIALTGNAQSVYVSRDSMNNSPHPGRYYIDLLKQATVWADGDTVEGDEKHANAKELNFWLDRITGGTNVDSPFYKYSYMMRNYTRGSCNPKTGDFNGNWENTGPKSASQSQGRVYDMYVDPANNNKIWLGTGNAGLWKTTNGGTNWTCVSDTWGTPPGSGIHGAGISAIAVNPFDANEMYVATRVEGGDRRNLMTWGYGQGVWHSTNGGTTWAIDVNGINDFQAMDFMEYCPYQLNGGTDEMIIATQYNHIWQKIGSGTWTDITPAALLADPLLIRDITFTTDVFGKFYISTQHNWINGVFYGPVIYECTYTAAGVVTYNIVLEHTNNGNGFVFDAVPNCEALAFETGYAGSNKLYIMVVGNYCIGGATEGHHTLYSYNISTAALTVEFPMPYCSPAPCKSLWRASVDVSPNSPDVVYIEGVRPSRLWKDGTGWHQYQFPNTGGAFHDDMCRTHIYYSDPAGNFANDIVYWGTDAGLTRTIGNGQANLNGDLITNEVYDIDVTELGKKRSAATFDNGIHGVVNNNAWQHTQFGDGFNTIYDKRFDKFTVPLLYHHDHLWQGYTHGNTLTDIGSFNQDPKRTAGGTIDTRRPFEFPHAFDDGYMYAGNRNMLRSSSMGYDVTPNNWVIQTNTGGDLDGGPNTVKDHCRAIAVSSVNGAMPQRMYFGLRYPEISAATNTFRVFFAKNVGGTWTDWTPTEIASGEFNLTDIVIDSKDPTRVFISMGMVDWAGPPPFNRVLRGDYDPVTDNMVWTNMSDGLSELPVSCLAYQNGSDDVIYAGTDAGVYRWDKPQGCWVKFNDAFAGGSAKMPDVIVHDMVIDYCNRRLVVGSYSRGVWESDLYYPNFFPDPTEIITANTTWGDNLGTVTNKVIEGSILIKKPYTLTIEGVPDVPTRYAVSSTTTVYMPKWGQILIEKGAKLVVNGAHITNECNTNWMGIYCYGHGAVPQTLNPLNGLDDNHGWVFLNNAIIEHAEEAMNNGGGNNSPWTNTGGILQAYNSHFINNHRSAAFYEYRNFSGTTLNADWSNIKYNLFDYNDNARIGLYAHISLWGVSGILINENIFNNTSTIGSTNPSHQTAVLSLDAGYWLKKNDFNRFYKGLEASQFSASYESLFPLQVTDNTFDKNEIGLHLINVQMPEISVNTINIGHRQTVGTGSFFSLGTKMESVSSFIYSYNTHIKTYTAPSSITHYTAGTEVHNTGQNDENINYNTYTDLMIGNDGDYTCANISNDKFGLKYTCNTNTDNTAYDFIFQANPYIRKTQSGVTVNTATGNVFSQGSTVINWYHTLGGNGPVNYVHKAVTNQTPNVSSFNYVPYPQSSAPCNNSFTYSIAKLDSSNYEELNESEMNSLKAQYKSYDSAFNIFNTLLIQLLDNGNTATLVTQIRNSTITEQLNTRADFLDMSPYVTQDALRELALREIVSTPILLEILLANPDATRNESFITFLEEEIALPGYMIEMIKASWLGPQSARNLLEENVSINHDEITKLKNHILRAYLLSDSIKNGDSLYAWMQKVPSIRNEYVKIEYLLYKGEITQANSLLNALPSTFKLSERDSIEHQAFINLYSFKRSLLEDSIRLNQLDSARITQLKVIADAEEYTFPRSMARNALCFFYHICYPDTVRKLPETGGKLPTAKKNMEKSKEITVYPNPASDYVVCYYNLLNKMNEAREFVVSDITGKQIYSVKLTGAQGQHIWDTRNVGNGNYIYSVTTGSGEKYSGKVTIQK